MTNLHETDRLVERLDAKALEAAETAINGGEFFERKLMAAQAITAYLDALTAMGGKAEPIGYIDRKQLDLIATQGRTDMATIWLEPYVPGHVPLYASPVQARTGEVTDTDWDEVDAVERMVLSLADPFPKVSLSLGGGIDHWREIMRAALEAALSSTDSNKQ